MIGSKLTQLIAGLLRGLGIWVCLLAFASEPIELWLKSTDDQPQALEWAAEGLTEEVSPNETEPSGASKVSFEAGRFELSPQIDYFRVCNPAPVVRLQSRRRLYLLCGGLRLGSDAAFGVSIVQPAS